MKSQLILLLIIKLILVNSNSFLQKIIENAKLLSSEENSIKTKIKQCRSGNTVFEVSSKNECKPGKWTSGDEHCSVSSIKERSKCTGTPIYTDAIISPAICKINDINIPLNRPSEKACIKALYWEEPKCNYKGIDKNECNGSGKWYPGIGTCTIGDIELNIDNKYECNNILITWDYDENDKNNGQCTIIDGYDDKCNNNNILSWKDGKCLISKNEIKSSEDCINPKWTQIVPYVCKLTQNMTIHANSENDCKSKVLTWIPGYCSVYGLNESDCKKTPIYTPSITIPAKCELGDIEITDSYRLRSKTACETALVWQNGICSNIQVTNKEDCEADDPEFIDTDPDLNFANLVNSSSFLKFKFLFALIYIVSF